MSYPNDNFASATVLSGSSGAITPFHYDGVGDPATSETGESVIGAGETLWWKWTAPFTGTAQVNTRFSPSDDGDSGGLDTKIQVLTDPTTVIAADDDDPARPSGSFAYNSYVEFAATAGTAYWFQVDMYGSGQAGTLHLAWGSPPPPAPTAGTWTEATGRDHHTAFPGDDITVNGTHLDVLDTVTVGGSAQTWTVVGPTQITVHIGSTAQTGPIIVANVSGSDPATGDLTMRFYGPWIQPADRTTSAPASAGRYYAPTDTEAGANIYPAQPDLAGEPAHGVGAFTDITVSNRKFPDPSVDPTWDWTLAGGLVLAQADDPQYSMPPIDYGPITAGDPSIQGVETEAPGGVAVTNIAVSFRADDLGPDEWSDSTDHKSATDISGDVWQTSAQLRRLASSDWTAPDLSHFALTAGSWPSQSWIAALPLDASVLLVDAGDTLDISTDDDSGTGIRVDNRAAHGTTPVTRLVPAASLTWTEYQAGVAWLGVLDRLVDAPPLSVPYVDSTALYPVQRKSVGVGIQLLMTWTYRPPRYRLIYDEPPVASGWIVGAVAW